MKPINRILRVFVFCLYLAAVALLCFLKFEQPSQIPATIFGYPADKIAHLCMFFPFPILGYLASAPSKGGFFKKIFLLTFLAGVGLSMAYGTERIQHALGYRSYDLNDMRANAFGLAVGYVFTISGIIVGSLKPKSGKKSKRKSEKRH